MTNTGNEERKHHEFETRQCQVCVHASAVRVERSSTHVRCGLEGCESFGKWSFSYYGDGAACPNFCEVTDPARKRKVNLAWLLSADRKRQQFTPKSADSNVVEFSECRYPRHLPFEEEV